jgi:hypothetical protein
MAHSTPGNNVAEIPNFEQTARKALRSSMRSPQEMVLKWLAIIAVVKIFVEDGGTWFIFPQLPPVQLPAV